MFNFVIKKVFKKAAFRLATDKKLRDKTKKVINNAKELNSKGELMRSLGKGFGRLKSKIREEL